MPMLERGIRVVALCAAVVAVSACDVTVSATDYEVREEKTFAVRGAARVTLSTFDGAIEVRGWDRPEVLVEVRKRAVDRETADQIRVQAKQDGSTIAVDVPQPDGFRSRHWQHRSPSASLVVSLPVDADLVLRSGDGSIAVHGVRGVLDVKTDDGSVSVKDAKGRILVRTGDGSVSGDRLDGTVDIETGDGSIALDGVLKLVKAETHDGSIRFTAREGSAMDGEWTLTTGDGSIKADLPRGFAAQIDAESGDGRVRVDGLTPEGRDRRDDERDRRRVTGTLGAGGKLLRVRSGDGSITVQLW